MITIIRKLTKNNVFASITVVLVVMLFGCQADQSEVAKGALDQHESSEHAHAGDHHGSAVPEVIKGPHRGRLLSDGDFSLELAIFETGVPPEFRAWASVGGKAIPAAAVKLMVEVTRLGDVRDQYHFLPAGQAPDDFLQAQTSVYEPHSFVVDIRAEHAGKQHLWQYESYEGRTIIDAKIAETAGVRTAIAGPAELTETITLFGKIAANPERQREISARFPGLIQSISKGLGDNVRVGETLAIIESNESLQSYAISAPLSGVLTQRDANVGEQSGDRVLFTITDTSAVIAELAVFPRDRARVQLGAETRVRLADAEQAAQGKLLRLDRLAGANQAITARVALSNPQGQWLAGSFVTADLVVARRSVPLAVKATGLQAFRDFTVVYAKVDETYEVRMLELGQRSGDWVEVLSGLQPGTQYVTENSYLIKADIEKSAAAHDH